MKIKVLKKKDATVCRVGDEINIHTIGELNRSFADILKEKPRKALLNLKDVNYIDSAGLAGVIEFSKKIKAGGGQFFLSDLTLKVRTIMSITKLNRAFSIFETEDDAFKTT
ncbi:MAG: STAS domain-containing protein [Candidatus Omnitrophota bacterium]